MKRTIHGTLALITKKVELSAIKEGFGYFWQFLIPTHKFDYLGVKQTDSPLFYVFDFFGRIAVGYGIYQFIQAFRKFK